MTTYEFLDLLIGFGTLVLTVLGLLFVWTQICQVKEQLCLQHFADYTKRYQEIVLRFPESINEASFDLSRRDDRDKVMRQMRAYVDLCYEEWFLRRTFELHDRVWQTWNGGMDTAFSKRAFKDAWAIIKQDSEYGSDFREFLDQKVAAIK